jgi:hypothetical protein
LGGDAEKYKIKQEAGQFTRVSIPLLIKEKDRVYKEVHLFYNGDADDCRDGSFCLRASSY